MHEHASRLRQDDSGLSEEVRDRGSRICRAFEPRACFDSLIQGRFVWIEELGIGHFPVTAGAAPYDRAYFDRYCRQADSDIGRALMAFRCDFVAKHWAGGIIDIGIGSGAFIEARHARMATDPGAWTMGFDVNPVARHWLQESGRYVDVTDWRLRPECFEAVTLWDVLEHIADPRPLLARVKYWAFVSIPVFSDAAHVLRSKHFRTDEHFWYFTPTGLIRFMELCGFETVASSAGEIAIGREDIGTFAFKRCGNAKW